MAQPMSWFTDIRKTALIACIASTLGNVLPVWNATQTIVSIASTHPRWEMWTIPGLGFVYLFIVTMPVFYFALYRDEGTLRLPKSLRLLSLAAAITFTIVSATELLEWIISARAGARSVLVAGNPWTISHLVMLLGELSNLAFILLLIALARQNTDQDNADMPASRLLNIVTKVTVIAWGIWLAFNLVQVVLTPYTYSQLRPYALQLGRTPRPLAYVMRDAIRALLGQVCLFAAPYVVYRGRLKWSRLDHGLSES